MKEIDHQNKHCELGGFPKGLVEPLYPVIHRPVFIVAIDRKLEVKTEKGGQEKMNYIFTTTTYSSGLMEHARPSDALTRRS